ncbi:MAG: LPS-assembly protein LptD [Treponema sp.]|nr:LPS-assembly protein LptD [Treponema sp.]
MKNIFRFRFLIFSLFLLFGALPLFSQENTAPNTSGSSSSTEEVTTITIKNARQTDYQKNEETENDTIILEGAVELTVAKGNSVSEIKAERVTYDRKTQMLYASGGVEITTKTDSSGGETTKASSLIMNTSTLEGVFDDGHVVQTQSDAINLPSGSTLVVFSDIFGKSENNTIVFKDSSLTFCDDPNPHWHIDASRTWLLPGGEFAFFNAVLYVGPVPVMYFPAFYYPKDELVFNPVFGFRPREGFYFQTTSYLYGRKPLDSSSSTSTSDDSATESAKGIYNFMKPSSLKEQELQGIVLHNLDKDYKGDTSKYIKFELDAYSNLGFFAGIEGNVIPQKLSFISSMKYDVAMAFSNTIFSAQGNYLSLSPKGNKYWDRSNFLGLDLPFRYKAKLDLSFSNPINVSISLPLYSDPYFAYDFENRSESMDWLSYLMSGKDTSEINITEISSLAWKINATKSFTIPAFLNPYISSASLSWYSAINISSTSNASISSDSRAQNADSWAYYSPERKIYYPSTVTPVKFNMNMNGTLFSWPQVSQKVNTEQYDIPLVKPTDIYGEPEEEKQTDEAEKTLEGEKTGEESKDSKDKKEEEKLELTFTELTSNPLTTYIPDSFTYRLNYNFNPDIVFQINYDETSLTSSQGFDWSKKKSDMYTIKAPLQITSSMNYAQNFLSMTNDFLYNPIWQGHPNTDGYTRAEDITNLKNADYNAESQTITNKNVISFKPFVYVPVFANSGISWNSTFKLLRKKYNGDANNPSWEYCGLDFTDADSVTENLLNLTIASSQQENKFSQSFVLSSTISPQLPKVSGTLHLTFPYVNFSLSTGVQQKSKEDSKWIKNPIDQTVQVSLLDSKLNFSQSLSYNLEDNCMESFKLSASYKTFSLSYVMLNTYAYNFDDVNHTGWISETTKSFIPYTLSLSYTFTPETYYKWFNRISIAPTLSTSVVADLVRPTSSYFLFTPGITFRINNFLNITFSATSRNSVLYRYFQTMLGHQGRIPGEENIFLDLFDSFRFDNEDLRKASGFKLKSLNLSITHELHDWDFSMILKFEPRLVTENGRKYYDYNPYFTLGITWRPMSSMKTTIVDDYGTIRLE